MENTITKNTNKISSADIAAITRFYESVVPGYKLLKKPCNVENFLKVFPYFEETIGKSDFTKLKKYFGIGLKKPKNFKFDPKMEGLVRKLRTIENALLYLDGYTDLIEKIARKLVKAPADMSNIEKAKLMRAYLYVFVGGQFFINEFKYLVDLPSTPIYIDKKSVESKKGVFLVPEDLWIIYDASIARAKDYTYFYDAILSEIEALDSKSKQDFFDFAELADVNGMLVSINKASRIYTFDEVRKLKKKVQYHPTFLPANTFVDKSLFSRFYFNDLYAFYKVVPNINLSDLPNEPKNGYIIEGSRIVPVKYDSFSLKYNDFQYPFYVAGEIEKRRFLNLINLLTKYEMELPIVYVSDDNTEEYSRVNVNVTHYLAAYKYALDKKYIDFDTPLEYDFAVLQKIVEVSGDKANLVQLWKDEISISDFEQNLKMDNKDLNTVISVLKDLYLPVDEETAAVNKFIKEIGVIEEENSEQAKELIDAYILPVFKQEFLDYYKDNNLEKLKNKVGFDDDFASMYFNLKNVKVTQIEEKLLTLKRNFASIKRSRLLVLLYVYLVENQFPCGVKNKPIKRKKNLKPEILFDLATK